MGRLHSGPEVRRAEMPPAVARGLHAARRGRRRAPSGGWRHVGRHGGVRVAARPAGHAARRDARVQQPRTPDDRGRHGRGQVARLPDPVRPLELHERYARRPLHRHAQPAKPAALVRPSARRAGPRRGHAQASRRRPEGADQLPLPAPARRADARRLVDALRRGERRVQATLRLVARDARRGPGQPRPRAAAPAALLSRRGLCRTRVPLPREMFRRQGARAPSGPTSWW